MTDDELHSKISQAHNENHTELNLISSGIRTLPPEIGQLSNLRTLYLSDNQLATLPSEIGNLKNLVSLYLANNLLTILPPEIGHLTNLRTLYLSNNLLKSLGPEIGQLANLETLFLSDNRLTKLPIQLAQLTKLQTLNLEGINYNTWTSPPPEIIRQGIQAIQQYLGKLLSEMNRRQWTSKLLVVGQGGAGKTNLLRRLRGGKFP